MLTKDFLRVFRPGTPGSPGVPYQPEHTVCQQNNADGTWEYVCARIEIPDAGEGLVIPPGGELIVEYDPDGALDPLTGLPLVVDSYIRVCAPQWVPSGDPPGEPVCTTYPEQPEIPATPSVPSRWDLEAINAWDAGANSIDSQEGDCRCVFTMGRVSGVVVGFTADLETVYDYARLSHALYFFGGSFQVMEYGFARSASLSFSPGDSFQLRRVGIAVDYLHNGVRVFTSRMPSFGEISVGASLYASGDSIP